MGQKGQQSLVTDRRGIAGRTAGLWRFGDRDGLGRGGGKGRVRHGWHGDKSSWGQLGWEGQVSGTSRALNYVFSLNFRGGLLLSSLSSSWRVLGSSEFWGPYMKGYKSFHGGASDISHKSQGEGPLNLSDTLWEYVFPHGGTRVSCSRDSQGDLEGKRPGWGGGELARSRGGLTGRISCPSLGFESAPPRGPSCLGWNGCGPQLPGTWSRPRCPAEPDPGHRSGGWSPVPRPHGPATGPGSGW